MTDRRRKVRPANPFAREIVAGGVALCQNLTMSQPLSLLVTGAAGFIGARFVESCNQRDIPVFGVDYRDAFNTRPEHKALKFTRTFDVDELFENLSDAGTVAGQKISGIIHMGACSSTTELNVEFLRRVNIEYSQTLWNFATRHGLPFVYASSAATYGDGDQGYEDDESKTSALRPLNPYGESKRLFDLWALEQESRGHAPPSWSGHKFFNVYGFGERHKAGQASVVLHAFDQIREKGGMKLFKSHKPGVADGHQERDFISVEDVVEVLRFALEKPIKRGIFNVGTGKARTFLDLARATFQALGAPDKIEFIETPEAIRGRYQYFTQATMHKLRAEGYSRPFTSLEEGVARYVARLLEISG